MIGVGKALASPPSEPCWRFSRTRLSSCWFPHRECLARYRTVDCVNSKKLCERGYSPPLTQLPAPTPCVPSVERLRLARVQVWSSHRLASLPRLAFRQCRNSLASRQTSRIQLPTSLPIGAVLLAAPLSVLQSNGIGAMKALTPAALTPRRGSLRLLHLAFPPFRSQPRVPSRGRFLSRLSALGHSRLRHYPAGSPRLHAESDSCSYGLAVRLRLLSTPAHTDAVTFGYMVTTLHDGDSHPADKASSQTHWIPGTSPGMTRMA